MPLPHDVAEHVQRQVAALGIVGHRLLLSLTNNPKPSLSTDQLTEWLIALERKTGLHGIAFTDWHRFRRKWASDRRGESLKLVMRVGAWRDASSALAYMQPDQKALEDAMAAGRGARPVISGAGARSVARRSAGRSGQVVAFRMPRTATEEASGSPSANFRRPAPAVPVCDSRSGGTSRRIQTSGGTTARKGRTEWPAPPAAGPRSRGPAWR